MPENSSQGFGHKIVSGVEQHPVLIAGLVAGAILGFVYLRNQSNSNSTGQLATTSNGLPVYTDSSGNPIDPYTGQALSGATVSPTMSNTDVATMLQDMEQQIINWEQNYTPPSSGGTGNTGTGTGLPTFPNPPPAPQQGTNPKPIIPPNPPPGINGVKPIGPEPLPTHNPPSLPSPPKLNGAYYVVKAGDYLSKIAAQFHITWQTLYNANKGVIGKNPNLIYAGEKLFIPGGSGTNHNVSVTQHINTPILSAEATSKNYVILPKNFAPYVTNITNGGGGHTYM